MLHQRAQAVAVGGDQHALVGTQFRRDAVFPIGQDAGNSVLEAFARRDSDAGVAAILREVELAAGFERGRGYVKATAPDLDLIIAMFGGGLCLVKFEQRCQRRTCILRFTV